MIITAAITLRMLSMALVATVSVLSNPANFDRNMQSMASSCDMLLEETVGLDNRDYCSCAQSSGQYVVQCELSNCPDCVVVAGQETCAIFLEDAIVDATEIRFLSGKSCVAYTQGFHSSTVCISDNADGSCLVSMDDNMCTSCTPTVCASGKPNYVFDCSNMGGAVYNGCDGIAAESPFSPFGKTHFQFNDCFDAAPPTLSPTSGAVTSQKSVAVAALVAFSALVL
jgi:hypothetical protein